MPILLQSAIGTFLRAGLMVLATWLTKHGICSDSDASKYVDASVVALLTIGWGLYQKYQSRVKFLTALMPGPKTEDEVNAHIVSGAVTPSVFTPTNTVPGVPAKPTN